MKVYGIEITENYIDVVYDSNPSDYYFDMTRVYTSKRKALEQMRKLALIEYEKVINTRGSSPTMTHNHNDGSIDVCAAHHEYRDELTIHYNVVEMELDEED